ncbi:MAG: 50S ribosomal protein L6 [bacterium]|nr:50S ribosomal protein L6 [bacterium]
MSRVGNSPLKLKAGVSFEANGRELTIKGPKGSVTFKAPAEVKVTQDGDTLTVERLSNSKPARAAHGLVRRVLGNNVDGVVTPYRRALEIVGVGYQVNLRGSALALKVGFANEIVVPIPEAVSVELASATKIVATSCDKHMVGQFAANVRRVRPPEPYNGKGIRYEGERIVRKAGKSFASAG